jgi:hypothetical protein
LTGEEEEMNRRECLSYNAPEAPLEAFRALHEKIGVERCVIVNATENPARLFKFT